PPTPPVAAPARRSCSTLPRRGRQTHVEHHSTLGADGRGDAPSVRIDGALGDGEAEPGAVRLEGEEGLEDVRQRVDRYARAGVADPQRGAAVRGRHAEGQLATWRVAERVGGVFHQVHDQLADALAIGSDHDGGFQVEDHGHVRRLEPWSELRHGGPREGTEIYGLESQVLAARELEQ